VDRGDHDDDSDHTFPPALSFGFRLDNDRDDNDESSFIGVKLHVRSSATTIMDP
jgi:hypothetical protein